MAVKNFYPLDTTAVTPGFWGNMQEDGTAPTAANTAGLINIAKLAANSFIRGNIYGAATNSGTASATSLIDSTSGPLAGTATSSDNNGDSMRTPNALTGSFPSGNWTLGWVLRATVANTQGRIRTRVWASANTNGSSARALTTSTQVSSTVNMSATATNFSFSTTWAAPAITLTTEYMFFQVEWQEITTAGPSNLAKNFWRVGDSVVTTTNFTAGSAPAPFTPYRTKHRIRR